VQLLQVGKMHPLIGDLSTLKDSEVDSKINDLTRKYFATTNFELQQQIVMALETYKVELAKRQQNAYEKMMNTRNKDLDKLIKVN
jgi:hypothetical protein